MSTTKSALAILILAAVGTACDTPMENTPGIDQEIGRVAGHVYDLDGQPLAGVTVDVQGMTATTGADGYYIVGEILPASAIPVKFTKPGYTTGWGRAELINWETTSVDGTLMPVDGTATFQADAGGTVEIEGVRIVFAPNNILDSQGNLYHGEVLVKSTHIDPYTDEILGAPGDLTAWAKVDGAGKDSSYTLNQLVSYGMINVELTTPEEEEELELDPEQPVDVSMPITNGDLPDVYRLANGDENDTWYFDPERSRWTEDGVGSVVEDEAGELAFEFRASHFSWWNCDAGYVPTCATGYVYDVLDFPIRSAQVQCRGSQTNSTVYTDENGLYVCTVMVGDTITVTATTTVGGRRWSKNSNSTYLYGYGSSAADCQPIDDIDIQVCRETGVITGGNFTAASAKGGDEYQSDLVEASFWEPKGDPELCDDPWNSLDMNECTLAHPDEIEKWVDNGEHMSDAYDDGRSVGDHLTISTDRADWTMDRDYLDGKPWYRWENYEDEGIFEDNDDIDVSAPGDSSDYMGRFRETNFTKMPNATRVAPGEYDGTWDSGDLRIRYEGADQDHNGVIVFVASENVYEADTCMCRFADDGDVSVPQTYMNQIDKGQGAVSVTHLNNHWAEGPDGLPIRVQLFAGTMLSVDLE
ncbi:MAG: carboxypeptidase-like regulatory domain-containing protein [Pseudomonadota bacterium]